MLLMFKGGRKGGDREILEERAGGWGEGAG